MAKIMELRMQATNPDEPGEDIDLPPPDNDDDRILALADSAEDGLNTAIAEGRELGLDIQ